MRSVENSALNSVIISHKVYWKYGGHYVTTGGHSIQMDALARYFDLVTLCVPVQQGSQGRGVGLKSNNIRICPLPFYRSKWEFLRLLPEYVQIIHAALCEAEIAVVMLPGYVGNLGSVIARHHHLPMFQIVVSDWATLFRTRSRGYIRRLVAPGVSFLIDLFMGYLTRGVVTFYTGRILYHAGDPHQYSRVSSTIASDSIWIHGEIREGPPYRVLFVGRLEIEKGLSHLLEAFASVLTDEFPMELYIVGDGTLRAELETKARKLGVFSRTKFLGYVPQGNRLLRIYRGSNLFVLPSLQEQQGKVLLEAMSNGIPVVATDVGGVPTVVQHGWNGLLVPAGDAHALTSAISRVIKDEPLRKHLIANGLEYARQHTVERETERMMHIVRRHFPRLFFHGEEKDGL